MLSNRCIIRPLCAQIQVSAEGLSADFYVDSVDRRVEDSPAFCRSIRSFDLNTQQKQVSAVILFAVCVAVFACGCVTLSQNYRCCFSTDHQPTQCINLDVSAMASFNINDGWGKACKNKSCIIPEEIHNMKYLVLFYLTETLREKKHAAQMRTHAFFSPMIPLGSPARQSSGAFAFQPAAHGLPAIKGCGVQKERKKKKAFKVVFGVPALPSQQAADFL